MNSSDARWSARGEVAEPARGGSTSHTRFIPREELTTFASWTPAALGQPAARPGTDFQDLSASFGQALSLRRTAGTLPGNHDFGSPATPPDATDTDAPADDWSAAIDTADASTADLADAETAWREAVRQELRDALQSEWQERADARCAAESQAARQSGYQDGYRDGLAALDSFKQSYASQVTHQVMVSFDRELQALEGLLADRVAQVATALARQVVRSELSLRPALVCQVAEEAVAALGQGARQVTLALHPDDQALVARTCADTLQALGVRLLPRPSVARGGVQVETDIGSIDARIATRWALAARAMGSDLAWTDGGDSPGGDA
jgi:flagellar assembly protein FliH